MAKKYKIESSTPGFPALERALFKAHDQIGWKSLTGFVVGWTNQHQPKDTPYSIAFWKPKKSPWRPTKTITISEKEYRELKKASGKRKITATK